MARYTAHDGDTFTHTSIQEALDAHERAGLIRSWHRDKRTHGNAGTREIPLYVVTAADGHEVHLANVWEASAFLWGLASARHAITQQARRVAQMERLTDA